MTIPAANPLPVQLPGGSTIQYPPIHLIWAPDRLELTERYRLPHMDLIAWLAERNDLLSGFLLSAKPLAPAKSDLTELVQEITLSRKNALECAKDQIVVLARLVQLGNQEGLWDLCPPQIPIHVKRERGVFTPARFARREAHRSWLDIIYRSITDDIGYSGFRDDGPGIGLSAEARTGRLLLTAALRGGLQSTATLGALLQSCRAPLILRQRCSPS